MLSIYFKNLDSAQPLECAEFLIGLKCVCEKKTLFPKYIPLDVPIKEILFRNK